MAVRVFREKDIPIQVALGSYDLGICGLTWIKELQVRFPEQPVVPLCDLGFGTTGLYAAAAGAAGRDLANLEGMGPVRIASEYPNLAEAFALSARLPSYRVQAVWGAAEAYPPEDADVAIVTAAGDDALRAHGLSPLFQLLDSSAWLIGNARGLESKDMSPALLPLLVSRNGAASRPGALRLPPAGARRGTPGPSRAVRDTVRMAVPDGHQQRHVVEALDAAGLMFEGYDRETWVRRPASGIPGLEVKVLRPHDMPQLVAMGQIDLAVTGRDCLLEHLYRFPSSPVAELLNLHRAQYNLSAVVSEDLPADDITGALAHWRAQGREVLRVASEFMGTADHYARSRHFPRYQVIPIAGASEGFVPEDAELLIEGTETGKTLVENRLKAIDLLYRSTSCVIGHREPALKPRQRRVFGEVLHALGRASRAAGPV
jgi:ATP phosphoribosyltransferase